MKSDLLNLHDLFCVWLYPFIDTVSEAIVHSDIPGLGKTLLDWIRQTRMARRDGINKAFYSLTMVWRMETRQKILSLKNFTII